MFEFLIKKLKAHPRKIVFEAVMGEEIDKRNFRKRVKDIDFIEKTELIDKVTSVYAVPTASSSSPRSVVLRARLISAAAHRGVCSRPPRWWSKPTAMNTQPSIT